MPRCFLAHKPGQCTWPYDFAHIGFSEHWLHKAPNGPRLDKAQANDRRLLRSVCRAHHHLLDYGSGSLEREDIPESVWEFAREFGLEWRLNRLYPLDK